MIPDINQAIKDVAEGLDALFTSDEERAKYSAQIVDLKLKMYQLDMDLQRAIVERSKGSKLPDIIGYMLIGALLVDLVLQPVLAKYGVHFQDLDETMLFGSLMALIGVGKLKK